MSAELSLAGDLAYRAECLAYHGASPETNCRFAFRECGCVNWETETVMGEGHVVLIAAVEDGGLPQSRDSRGHSRRGTQQPARPCHAVAHVRLRREGERDVRSARQGPEHAKADYDAARRQGTSRRASSRYASRWPGSAPSTSTWQASGRTTCSSKTGWAI